MKIRNGFVSNSSSSSFICDVCGHDEAGYDLGLEDAEMYECQNGHIFCESHEVGDFEEDCKNLTFIKEAVKVSLGYKEAELKKEKDKILADQSTWIIDKYPKRIEDCQTDLQRIEDVTDEDQEELADELVGKYGLNDRYAVPTLNCPICQLKSLRDVDTIKYALKKLGTNEEDMIASIVEEFGTYDKFMEYLK